VQCNFDADVESWEIAGGDLGSAILQRYSTTMLSWSESVVEMVVMLSTKKSSSPERISRSESGTWPLSWADTISRLEWSSDGKSGDLEGRSSSDWIKIWDEMKFVRASVRLCIDVNVRHLEQFRKISSSSHQSLCASIGKK
jgi:hypothetical protein